MRILIVALCILFMTPAQARHHHHRHHHHRMTSEPGSVVSHPAGCPGRAFCGCGAAVRVFGRPVRELWLAANWFKYPRTSPASGMVGVRRHHVFVLESHVSGDVWMVYDANSGHRATRIHARSISGYAIVNPRG